MLDVRRVLSFSILSAFFLLLTGCAFGTRQPTLTYPPKAESGETGVAHAASAPAAKPVTIVLRKFTDQRSDRRVVGTVRNGFGMKTADVVPTNDVADWVTEAIRSELQSSGYTVLDAAAETDPVSAVVSGEILNVYCDMYLSYTGQVSLLARVSRGEKELFNRHYAGEGSTGLAWAGTADSYNQSLALALAEALHKFVPELNQQLAME